MAFDLHNTSGSTLRVSGGHWAVLLILAECYGWKPAGTLAPPGFPPDQQWNRRYDSNDGQIVAQEDAVALAKHLHGAAVSPQLNQALADVIRSVEKWAEAQGLKIPDGMRMKPEHFHREFSPLLLFLYEGQFSIE